MQLIVKSNYMEISLVAAGIISDAITASPRMKLCLAAGNTPTGTYRELVRLHRSAGLDFSNVTFFYLDEYFGIPASHRESFRSYLERELFDHINATRTNIYAPGSRYDETIQNSGGIDLLICGIGGNGHIAFNEPGSAMDSRTRIVDLAESTIEGLRGKFRPEEMPRQGITMGLATIMASRQILMLANGKKKAGILERALKGPVTTDVPASMLQSHPGLTVITDQEISN